MTEFSGRTFYSKIASSFILKLLLTAVGVIKGILLARLLGPTARGNLAIAVALQQLGATLATAGQDNAAAHLVGKSPEAAKEIASNCLWHSLVAGGLAGIVVIALGTISPQSFPIGTPLLLVASLSIPLPVIYQLLRSIILGQHKVSLFNGSELLGQSLSVLALLFLNFSIGLSLFWSFVVAQLLPCTFSLIVSAYYSQVSWSYLGAFRPALARTMWAIGIRVYLLSAILFLLSEMNLFFVAHLFDSTVAGYYAVAQRGASMLTALSLPFSQLLLPYLSTNHATSQQKWRLVNTSLLIVTMTSLLAAILVGGFITQIIALLYGEEYLPAAAACRVMLLAQVAQGAVAILLSFWGSRGYPMTLIYLTAMLLLFGAVGSYFAVSSFGLSGASYSFLVSQSLLAVTIYLFSRSHSNRS